MTSNLMFFKTLLVLVICELELFINLLALSKLIGIIICFLDGHFIVIFSLGLGLLSLLIIFWIFSIFLFWIFSIFLFWRLGNAFLIFRVSLAVLELVDDAWAYDLLSGFFLKNLEISTTSFGNFAGIRGGRAEMNASLFVSLPFLGVMSLFICGLN